MTILDYPLKKNLRYLKKDHSSKLKIDYMKLKRVLMASLLCSTVILSSKERLEDDVRKEAYEELDKGLKEAGLAGVDFWLGGLLATRGEAIGTSIAWGKGIDGSVKAYDHFQKANKLFEELRERDFESQESENRYSEPKDHDSWDHDY